MTYPNNYGHEAQAGPTHGRQKDWPRFITSYQPPTDYIGQDGEGYIDLKTGRLYKKEEGTWVPAKLVKP